MEWKSDSQAIIHYSELLLHKFRSFYNRYLTKQERREKVPLLYTLCEFFRGISLMSIGNGTYLKHVLFVATTVLFLVPCGTEASFVFFWAIEKC